MKMYCTNSKCPSRDKCEHSLEPKESDYQKHTIRVVCNHITAYGEKCLKFTPRPCNHVWLKFPSLNKQSCNECRMEKPIFTNKTNNL